MGSLSPQPLNTPGMVNLVTSVRSRAVHAGAGRPASPFSLAKLPAGTGPIGPDRRPG
jgi:hypothetical protein